MSKLPEYTIRQMLDSGIHYGHKKNRWNPQMLPFIYGSKGDLHIIDLTKTYVMLGNALQVIANVAQNNGKILFIGTKRQSASVIAEYAEQCKQFYVNYRWLGGMLTNWSTVSNSIKTLKQISEDLGNTELQLTKKEKLQLSRKFEKLDKSLGGIKDLVGKPDLAIVFDTKKEAIAVKELAKLNIPTVAIVDTNAPLDDIDYPIAGNDDSAKATAFFCKLFAEAVSNFRVTPPAAEQENAVEVKATEKPADDAAKEVAASDKTAVTKEAEVKTEVKKKAPAVKKAEPVKKAEADTKAVTKKAAPKAKAEPKKATAEKKESAKKADKASAEKKEPAKKAAAAKKTTAKKDK